MFFGLLKLILDCYDSYIHKSVWNNLLFPIKVPLPFSNLKRFLTSSTFQTNIRNQPIEYYQKMDIYSLGLLWAVLFGDTHPDIWNLTLPMLDYNFFQRIEIEDLYSEYKKIVRSF